jgi:hypothetical protein
LYPAYQQNAKRGIPENTKESQAAGSKKLKKETFVKISGRLRGRKGKAVT